MAAPKERAASVCAPQFANFKREMVRLDYTAQQLREAIQKATQTREKAKQDLHQATEQVESRAARVKQRRFDDDLQTLELEKSLRLHIETRQKLQMQLFNSEQKRKELSGKREKLANIVNSLRQQQHLLSGLTGDQDSLSKDNADLMRIRMRQKERNVVGQSQLFFQACKLSEPTPDDDQTQRELSELLPSSLSDDLTTASDVSSTAAVASAQFLLADVVFTKIQKMYESFISAKSTNYEPLDNFGAIERYTYHLLDVANSCDSKMLSRIICKVVTDKKLQSARLKAEQQAGRRSERERVALARAMAAPAQFQRVTIDRKQMQQHARSKSRQRADASDNVIFTKQKEDLSYLFILQQ